MSKTQAEQVEARPARCANCDTPLQGPWCHACGQKGEDFHRSIGHLFAETFEGLTHFDGRFWNTAPRLARDPGGLTRDYLAGKRAAQIPPFRLFLVMLLILFFTAGLGRSEGALEAAKPAPAERRHAQELLQEDLHLNVGGPKVSRWLRERILHAAENPEAVFASMEHRAHLAAILLLPLAALLLGALFAFRRGVFLFDHLIFSMHSLAFQGLLLSAAQVLGLLTSLGGWLLLASPVHLFVHMRGTYGGSAAATLLRMTLLFAGSVVVVAVLALGLLVVGVAEAH